METKQIEELKKELETQDNSSTANPFFVVYEDREYPTTSDYSEDWNYMDLYDGANKIGKTKESLKEYYEQLIKEGTEFEEKLDEEEYKDFTADDVFEWMKKNCGHCQDYLEQVYYFLVERFVSAFFTRKSAQNFIDKNSYHYTNPHIYVHSFWRNYEMQDIRNHFLGEKSNV